MFEITLNLKIYGNIVILFWHYHYFVGSRWNIVKQGGCLGVATWLLLFSSSQITYFSWRNFLVVVNVYHINCMMILEQLCTFCASLLKIKRGLDAFSSKRKGWIHWLVERERKERLDACIGSYVIIFNEYAINSSSRVTSYVVCCGP